MNIRKKIISKLSNNNGYTVEEKMILRDYLALQRTRLANERTYLSYIKFSLYLLVGGVTLITINYNQTLEYLGMFAIVVSGVSLIVGTIRFFYLKNQLKNIYNDGYGNISED